MHAVTPAATHSMVVQDANVYLEGEQIAELDALADDEDSSYESRSDAVRTAVAEFLERTNDTGEA